MLCLNEPKRIELADARRSSLQSRAHTQPPSTRAGRAAHGNALRQERGTLQSSGGVAYERPPERGWRAGHDHDSLVSSTRSTSFEQTRITGSRVAHGGARAAE